MKSVVRSTAALVLAMLCASPAALAVDSGDIVVVAQRGEVHFTVNGAVRTIRAGGVLEPPATLLTGRDGSVDLRQGATTVRVGPDTLLEFPALEKRGAPIDRILQPRGNAFYDIGKREGRKLRIETPYLVGVIKGTQFNVAALDESTTISLFEGRLEVRAPDNSSVVDLAAGEIASRRRDDKSIGVMKMESGKAPASKPRPSSGNGSNSDKPGSAPPRARPLDNVGNPVLVDLDTYPAANGASAGVADTSTTVSVNAPGAEVTTSTTVDTGAVVVDTGAAVVAEPTPVDVVTNTNVEANPVTADVGGSAAVDLPTAAVDSTTSVDVDAGPLTTDVDADTSGNNGRGNAGITVVVGASAPQVEVTVGSERAAEAVANNGNVRIDIAGASDLDLGVDDALDDGNQGNGNGNANGSDNGNSNGNGNSNQSNPGSDNATPGVDAAEALERLLHRSGKK